MSDCRSRIVGVAWVVVRVMIVVLVVVGASSLLPSGVFVEECPAFGDVPDGEGGCRAWEPSTWVEVVSVGSALVLGFVGLGVVLYSVWRSRQSG